MCGTFPSNKECPPFHPPVVDPQLLTTHVFLSIAVVPPLITGQLGNWMISPATEGLNYAQTAVGRIGLKRSDCFGLIHQSAILHSYQCWRFVCDSLEDVEHVLVRTDIFLAFGDGFKHRPLFYYQKFMASLGVTNMYTNARCLVQHRKCEGYETTLRSTLSHWVVSIVWQSSCSCK